MYLLVKSKKSDNFDILKSKYILFSLLNNIYIYDETVYITNILPK